MTQVFFHDAETLRVREFIQKKKIRKVVEEKGIVGGNRGKYIVYFICYCSGMVCVNNN